MANTIKTLAQSNPSAASLTDLYTVPGGTSATVSTITVCNQGATTTFRVSVAVAGAADVVKQYIYRDLQLTANDTFAATLGITLGAGDKVRIYAGTANLSFNLFGCEVT